MELLSTLDYRLIKDCVLIGLCAVCALYCLLLSKRLRALSNNRTGLGASIVSLTEAIETTHQASQASRRDISASILEMQDLINQADSKANALEARLSEIRRDVKTADQVARALNTVLDLKAPKALDQIRLVSDKLQKLAESKSSEEDSETETTIDSEAA